MEDYSKPLQNLQTEQLAVELHSALRALVHPHSRLETEPLRKRLPCLFGSGGSPSTDAIRRILEPALERMEAQIPELARLLRERFWEGRTMEQLAVLLGRSTSGLYAMQAQAVRALAKTAWEMEEDYASRKAVEDLRRLRNLPPQDRSRLFGTEETAARVLDLLRDARGPRVISIEGLGGLGKTALVNAVVRAALAQGGWDDAAWVSAVDRPFYLWDAPQTPPPLNPQRILEEIARQLGAALPAGGDATALRLALQEHFLRNACLVVIEDLEPEHRPNLFLADLPAPQRPTRFLLTSRQQLGYFPGCANLSLRELGREPGLALIRQEAEQRGFAVTSADAERIFSLVGGNPLAIQLVVGQAASLPFERVLDNLVDTTRGAEAKQFLQLIYRHSWKYLDASARRALFAMTRFPPLGATYEELLAESGMPAAELDSALRQLVAHSMVAFDPGGARRYTIHRLTYIFLWTLEVERAADSPETLPLFRGPDEG